MIDYGSSYHDYTVVRTGEPTPADIRVTAALSWYDEDPETLRTCVAAVAGIADDIVALDGAYARFPGAKVRSPRGQAEAIRDMARAAGIGATVYQVDRLWAGQVEKRTALLTLAAIGSDWIASVDADHVVVCPDRTAARHLLATSPGIDVYEVPFYTPVGQKPVAEAASGQWHQAHAGIRTPIPHIFRSLPGYRVELYHWWYSALKNGQRTWLWGGDSRYPVAPHGSFVGGYEVEHRCLVRDERHVLANRAFCNDRELVKSLTGQEDDRPGLPAPVFDYVSTLV